MVRRIQEFRPPRSARWVFPDSTDRRLSADPRTTSSGMRSEGRSAGNSMDGVISAHAVPARISPVHTMGSAMQSATTFGSREIPESSGFATRGCVRAHGRGAGGLRDSIGGCPWSGEHKRLKCSGRSRWRRGKCCRHRMIQKEQPKSRKVGCCSCYDSFQVVEKISMYINECPMPAEDRHTGTTYELILSLRTQQLGDGTPRLPDSPPS